MCNTTPSATQQNPGEQHPVWNKTRTEFLNEPGQGPEFLKKLDKLVWLHSCPWIKSRSEATVSMPFSDAMNFVQAALLSDATFPAQVEQYNLSTRQQSIWSYLQHAVVLKMGEWKKKKLNDPTIRVAVNSEWISDARRPAADDDVTDFPCRELAEQISREGTDREVAALMLRIWTLRELPDAWRARYLPVIIKVAGENNQSPEKTLQTLQEALIECGMTSEQQMTELQARIMEESELCLLYARRKDARYRVVLDKDMRLSTGKVKLTADHLTESCRIVVSRSSADQVTAESQQSYDEMYSNSKTGAKTVRNRVIFEYEQFRLFCYRNKIHRESWLFARRSYYEISAGKGLMPYRQISAILGGVRTATLEADVAHLRARLQIDGPLLDVNNRRDAESELEFIQQQLSLPELKASICGRLGKNPS